MQQIPEVWDRIDIENSDLEFYHDSREKESEVHLSSTQTHWIPD